MVQPNLFGNGGDDEAYAHELRVAADLESRSFDGPHPEAESCGVNVTRGIRDITGLIMLAVADQENDRYLSEQQ